MSKLAEQVGDLVRGRRYADAAEYLELLARHDAPGDGDAERVAGVLARGLPGVTLEAFEGDCQAREEIARRQARVAALEAESAALAEEGRRLQERADQAGTGIGAVPDELRRAWGRLQYIRSRQRDIPDAIGREEDALRELRLANPRACATTPEALL